MNLKSQLNELTKLGIKGISAQLENSAAYKYVVKAHAITEPRKALTLSSVFVVLLKAAWLDRELSKLEVKYLLRETGDWFTLNDTSRLDLINVCSSLVRKNINFKKFIPFHLAYLGETLNNEDKKFLLETIVVISRSDLEVHQTEENFIELVGEFLKIPQSETAEYILNAKFLVESRLDKLRTPETEEDEAVHEIPEIKLEF